MSDQVGNGSPPSSEHTKATLQLGPKEHTAPGTADVQPEEAVGTAATGVNWQTERDPRQGTDPPDLPAETELQSSADPVSQSTAVNKHMEPGNQPLACAASVHTEMEKQPTDDSVSNHLEHAGEPVPQQHANAAYVVAEENILHAKEHGNPPGAMQLFVVTSNRQICKLLVDHSDTVGSLKATICSISGIPVQEQKLTLFGRVLQNQHKLQHYSVNEDCPLELHLPVKRDLAGFESLSFRH